MKTPVSVIILAAGKGARMKSDLPKVLHKVGGLPMLFHVSNAGKSINPEHMIAIVGHGANMVEEACEEYNQNLELVLQMEQLGTGHAVMQAEDSLDGFKGDIVILTGDCPLMTNKTVKKLLNSHQKNNNAITFLSAEMEDPTGLGRVKRNANGEILGIVEHKDSTKEELKIKEINTGLYVVKSEVLFNLLKNVKNENAQGEYYLPDIITLALNKNLTVGTATTSNGKALLGVNSKDQLKFAESIFQNRINRNNLETSTG